jgi:monothiol glutaredoxin|tara:strand:+ start:757 stop:1071 length:315 start_codon:yes stop_codon:yes gene_type:complete
MDVETKKNIENKINNDEICLFMKGTPEMPQCGFSMAVVNILKIMNLKFSSVDVLKDEKIRQGIKEFSDWPTIPQLYVKGKFVGGCDIVKEMYEKKELHKLLGKQ